MAENATGSGVGRGPRVRGGQLARVGRLPRRQCWRRRRWPTTGGWASCPGRPPRTRRRPPPAISWVATSSASPASSARCGTRRRRFDGVSAELAIGGSALGHQRGGRGLVPLAFGTNRPSRQHGPESRLGCPPLPVGQTKPSSHTGSPGRGSARVSPSNPCETASGTTSSLLRTAARWPCYVDGAQVHTATNATGSDLAASPWHVMRNGTNHAYAAGEADELGPLHAARLGPAEIQAHYNLARDLADDPLPASRALPAPSRRSRVRDRPAACSASAGPAPPAHRHGARAARRADRPRRAGRAEQPDRAQARRATGSCATGSRGAAARRGL